MLRFITLNAGVSTLEQEKGKQTNKNGSIDTLAKEFDIYYLGDTQKAFHRNMTLNLLC
jgi:hypothetical protein